MYIETHAKRIDKLIAELKKHLSAKEYRPLNRGTSLADIVRVAHMSTAIIRKVFITEGYILTQGKCGGTAYKLTEKFNNLQDGDFLLLAKKYRPKAKNRPLRGEKSTTSRVVETQLPDIEVRTAKALSVIQDSELYAMSEKCKPAPKGKELSELDRIEFLADIFPKHDTKTLLTLIREHDKL